jgi:hypothetical protein
MQEDVAAPAAIGEIAEIRRAASLLREIFSEYPWNKKCLLTMKLTRLKQLPIAAKNHPSRTLGRQQAMTKLITEIEKYKIINCPQTTNFFSEKSQ